MEWAKILVGGYLLEMALVRLAHRFRKYGLVSNVLVMAFVQYLRHLQGNGYDEEKEPRGLMRIAWGIWRSDETWLYPLFGFCQTV